MIVKSVVILAGGEGTRLNGKEKTLLRFRGKAIIEYMVSRLSSMCEEIVISIRDTAQEKTLREVLERYDLIYAVDAVKGIGPLAGIYAGLNHSYQPYSMVLGGDMPFINLKVVEYLFEETSGEDLVIPSWGDGRIEPLHAIYQKKSMILAAERAIEEGHNTIIKPISYLEKVKEIPIESLRKLDPSLETFININTRDDLVLLER